MEIWSGNVSLKESRSWCVWQENLSADCQSNNHIEEFWNICSQPPETTCYVISKLLQAPFSISDCTFSRKGAGHGGWRNPSQHRFQINVCTRRPGYTWDLRYRRPWYVIASVTFGVRSLQATTTMDQLLPTLGFFIVRIGTSSPAVRHLRVCRRNRCLAKPILLRSVT